MRKLDWQKIDGVISNPAIRTVLLYGAPGTGKTTAAHNIARKNGQPVYSVTFSEDMSAQELVGHWIQGDAGFRWNDGPAILAWKNAGMFIGNEVDKASGSTLVELYSILDDITVAGKTLSSGESVRPAPGFRAICTMNGDAADLPAALLDRFQVKIEVCAPHPDALARINNESLRAAVSNAYESADGWQGLSFRDAMAFMALVEAGFDIATAAIAAVGPARAEILERIMDIGARES